MAKKSDDKKDLPAFEDFLAPWEVDADGNKLDEPADIDPARLKKHLHNLLSDKEKLQSTIEDKDTELAQVKDQLTTIQREHEDEATRRAREEKEREERYSKLEKAQLDREKVDAIAAAFEDQGITAARARKLASRVTSTDPKDWVSDAQDLVDDGFRISDKAPAAPAEDDEPTIAVRPRVVRSDGTPAEKATTGRPKSVAEELDAAGIGRSEW